VNRKRAAKAAALSASIAAAGAGGYAAKPGPTSLTDHELAGLVVSRASNAELRDAMTKLMAERSEMRKQIAESVAAQVRHEVQRARRAGIKMGPRMDRQRWLEEFGEAAVMIDPAGRDLHTDAPSVPAFEGGPIHLRRCPVSGRRWSMTVGLWYEGEFFPAYADVMREVQP